LRADRAIRDLIVGREGVTDDQSRGEAGYQSRSKEDKSKKYMLYGVRKRERIEREPRKKNTRIS
jgi:hypothetical protein